jgi:biotin synthase-related radical SAM superfamily protein
VGKRLLRARLGDDATWRVSLGTAQVLGLAQAPLDAAPTTAYLMLGDRCVGDCAFCSQARSSQGRDGMLSRIIWPEFGDEDVCQACAAAHARGAVGRACFQVTMGPDAIERTRDAVARLAACSSVPTCASVMPRDLSDVAALLEAGAERVTIALDAATDSVYRQVKSGSYARVVALLEAAAAAHPGRIGTHLIVGLGESERDMAQRIQWALDRGIMVALFAFTPVRGTAMADVPPPPLATYRRLQAARWLMVHGHIRAEELGCDRDGRITSLGLPAEELASLLADSAAFRTSGCPDCNRPYYNERPGGVIYNYPRPLTPEEARREVATLLAHLGG